ncbi:AraC family transcriptional regulator [Flavihumibacter sp. R14]|nr:AraC family transcriptional regulator [Flavihumibacter soli]
MKRFINPLPQTPIQELKDVVEHRRVYSMAHCELNIFETIHSEHQISFCSNYPVISTMVTGKKIIRFFDEAPFDYLPGESIIIPANGNILIDFPDTSEINPTQCTVLYLDHQKISEAVTYINESLPRAEENGEWKLHFDHCLHFHNNQSFVEVINNLIQIICSEEYLVKEPLVEIMIKELIIRILQQENLRFLQENSVTYSNTNRFAYLIKYIDEHLTSTLKITDLCQIVYMSKPSLFRTFKNEFGISPIEFIIRERIRLAKNLLASQNSIKESCFKSGFNNLHYFVRTFKRVEGITPKTYTSLLQTQ